jgi:hypothetical protein
VIANIAYALLYEQTLAWWAVHASADRHGHMPDPLDLIDEAVS